MNPLPDGPVPCVWPVQVVEALAVADGMKLVGWVEKQMKRSLTAIQIFLNLIDGKGFLSLELGQCLLVQLWRL